MASLSVWERETYYAPQDVVIIGAGLMGLWTALTLKQQQPGLRVLIVERHATPLGASTRNAGFACFGSASELLYDAQLMGEEAMLSVVEARYKGIEKIRRHFKDAVIDYDACGGYECLLTETAVPDQLSYLNRLLQPIVGVDATFCMADERLAALGLSGFEHLVYNPLEGGLHSGKLVQALTAYVQQAGVNILYAAEVKSYDETGSGVTLNINEHTLTAGCVLFCTNAFTTQLLPHVGVTPGRGQVLLTTPIEGLALRGTFHFDEGFYYWRNLGNRILLGGGRNVALDAEATTDLNGSDLIRDTLQVFLQQHIASSYSYAIESSWSGIMGFTANKKPLLQTCSARTAVAIACNGMGVALTPYCAIEAAALVKQML